MPKHQDPAPREDEARELMRHIEVLADRVLSDTPADLSRREASALRTLATAEGAMAMTELAERLGLALSTATGLMDRLVGRKLVGRSRPAADRRTVLITVTARGRKAQQEHDRGRIAFATALLSALQPDERRRLIETFRKIASGRGR